MTALQIRFGALRHSQTPLLLGRNESASHRGGRNKGGRKQMRANANKRRQTQANAEAKTQANATKREQTWTNADKRLHPPLLQFFTPPFPIPFIKRGKLHGTIGFLRDSAVFCVFLRNFAENLRFCVFLRKSAENPCCQNASFVETSPSYRPKMGKELI